jgi:hypothetical protein
MKSIYIYDILFWSNNRFIIMVNWIDSDSSVLRHASGDFKRLGNRIFVFMVGGATRSEVRLVLILHKKIQIPNLVGIL